MSQLGLSFHSADAPQIGEFSYRRPIKTDSDYEEWKQFLVMFLVARLQNGETPSDDLAERGRAYPDRLHSKIFAMKA